MAVTDVRTWTIRHARPDDGRPVRRFVFDILNEYHVPADPDDSDADVMAFGAPADGVVQLVAEVDGEPIGSAILTPYSDTDIKLSKLFLKPEFRGRGLGREMLARSEAEAKALGYSRISLCTRALYVEAVRLYERAGWSRGPDQPPPGPDRLYYRDL
ncbi:GNAT family N-acetyltransferase [Solirubrobacter soli]|uniref:GNAT family N-acetyltransferase n=1 Tax=Solirubrobacter soli TaxID=363832 RepID=UPI0003F5D197|nr:GNAT family N-acetyltransferase [Solirubrobacter soli]